MLGRKNGFGLPLTAISYMDVRYWRAAAVAGISARAVGAGPVVGAKAGCWDGGLALELWAGEWGISLGGSDAHQGLLAWGSLDDVEWLDQRAVEIVLREAFPRR